ncbi:MaoC/PaaZ C-terminal domain-containing protein [Chloroflexota bacterium]
MPTEYYEDIKLHKTYRSREYHLSEEEIIDFAKQWDPQPFHTDPEFAKNTRFGGLFASGAHLMVICVKLDCEREPKPSYIAGLGSDESRNVAPARPGDILVMEIEAISKRKSKSDPNAGVVRYITRLLNQREEPLIIGKFSVLVEKRDKR